MKKVILLAAIAATAMVGCSKTESNDNGNDTAKAVSVKFSQPAENTRGVGKHVGNVVATVNNATVYFTNSTGGIMDYVTVAGGTSADAAYDAASKTVGINIATTTGFRVEDLPGSVSSVYVVGNYPGTYPTDGNMAQLKTASSISVLNQFDPANKGVASVTLIGHDASLSGSGSTFEAEVEIKPVVARIEVGRVTAAGRIRSFTLEGIYINNTHETMGIEGMVAAPARFFGPEDGSKFVGGAIPFLTKGMLFDEATDNAFVSLAPTAISYAPKANPSTNDVWGYNVLAPQSTAPGAALPHVIIKIKDVVIVSDDKGTPDTSDDVLDNSTYGGQKWLTIRNYYTKSSPTAPLALFAAGNVYRLGVWDTAGGNNPAPGKEGDLIFDEDDLTDKPELGSVDVTVTVSVMKWIENEVGYDFN